MTLPIGYRRLAADVILCALEDLFCDLPLGACEKEQVAHERNGAQARVFVERGMQPYADALDLDPYVARKAILGGSIGGMKERLERHSRAVNTRKKRTK
jgi:hypothetical protein